MTRMIVHSAGPGVSIQDGGRQGYLRFGVTRAGPMDRVAHATANLAVGNDRDATAIEVSLGGVEISSESAALDVAVAGGRFNIARNGKPMPAACRVTLRPGERLKIAAGETGAWCYLAVAAAFDLSKVLGSQATHTRSGFGGVDGRCLLEGDRIGLASTRSFQASEGALVAPWLERSAETIRVLPGPQRHYFDAENYQAFLDGPWELTVRSDRMAIFVDGPGLRHSEGYDIVSDGVVMGSIQVPGDGVPIVLMADSQPTGGYPKIASVISADLGLLAQMRAGSRIRFAEVSHDNAVQERAAVDKYLSGGIDVEPLVRSDFTRSFLASITMTDGLLLASKAPKSSADQSHERGQLTASERLSLVFDGGAFSSICRGNLLAAEGTIYGRSALAFAKDPSRRGGTIGEREMETILHLRERAQSEHLPLVGLYDGAAIDQEHAAAGFSAFSKLATQRAVAQNLEIALALGQCVGPDAVQAALADIVLTVGRRGGVALAGPELVQQIYNDTASFEDLASHESLADARFDDELAAFSGLRRVIALLVGAQSAFPDLDNRISPGLDRIAAGAPYDMRDLLRCVADHGDTFEFKPADQPSMVTVLLRMAGQTCGVIASQPLVDGGALSADGMAKAADFASFCDRRRIPLLRFVDSPGILPTNTGSDARPLAAAARLVKITAGLTVPCITVVTGQARGLATLVMGGSQARDRPCIWWRTEGIGLHATQTDDISASLRQEVVIPSETRSAIIRTLYGMTKPRE